VNRWPTEVLDDADHAINLVTLVVDLVKHDAEEAAAVLNIDEVFESLFFEAVVFYVVC
jgi:hypothetical protein